MKIKYYRRRVNKVQVISDQWFCTSPVGTCSLGLGIPVSKMGGCVSSVTGNQLQSSLGVSAGESTWGGVDSSTHHREQNLSVLTALVSPLYLRILYPRSGTCRRGGPTVHLLKRMRVDSHSSNTRCLGVPLMCHPSSKRVGCC